MAQNISTRNPHITPDEIRRFLKERFNSLPKNALEKMHELQAMVKKYPAHDGISLADELIADRRKEES